MSNGVVFRAENAICISSHANKMCNQICTHLISRALPCGQAIIDNSNADIRDEIECSLKDGGGGGWTFEHAHVEVKSTE